LTEDTTLTNLVAEFALIATPEGWTDLLDLLVGSLIVLLRWSYLSLAGMSVIYYF
jgi:hypothetical protein